MTVTLPDPDDLPFLEVAATLRVPLVTSNLRHFPIRSRRGVEVVTPRQFLDRLGVET
jgi:predicted nucleic acid-binding protein